MADKDFYPLKGRNPEEVRIVGRFKPNGSSAITNTKGTTVFGEGWSVARSNTGIYAVTILGLFGSLLHVSASLMSTTIADGGQFRFAVAESGGNTVLTMTHYGEDAGGIMQAEDIAAADANFVTFEAVFLNRKGVTR